MPTQRRPRKSAAKAKAASKVVYGPLPSDSSEVQDDEVPDVHVPRPRSGLKGSTSSTASAFFGMLGAVQHPPADIDGATAAAERVHDDDPCG